MSWKLNPTLTAPEIFWLPRDMEEQMKPRLAEAARLMLPDLDGHENYGRWFMGGHNPPGLPSRSGYYLGYLMAKHLDAPLQTAAVTGASAFLTASSNPGSFFKICVIVWAESETCCSAALPARSSCALSGRQASHKMAEITANVYFRLFFRPHMGVFSPCWRMLSAGLDVGLIHFNRHGAHENFD